MMLRWFIVLYRAVLAAAPEEFRRRYGDEAVEVAARRVADRSRLLRLPAAVRELSDLAVTIRHERRTNRPRLDTAVALIQDMRVACRSLLRAKGLAVTVIVTLALGIGANAAIFSVVRGVLLRPLVNRDEDRLVYIRQTAPGAGDRNVTFSMPEIHDLESRVRAVAAFGDFSTINFTLIGLGEPRIVKAGVVGGSFFDVMGLRPVLGRLLDAHDDGPAAEGAVVLTYRFWMTSLNGDPAVVGRGISLGPRTATVVGVLEPSVPYPADTEIIANIVTSPHHLSATMVTSRVHRMTELFGRLAPGATIESARAELAAAHDAIVHAHPDAYSSKGAPGLTVTRLRDQIAAPARTILLVLLAAAGIVFVIACSNVANLVLARSIRRQGELAVRAALGAGPGTLRRTLLAESLVLCGAGAVLGCALANPLVTLVSSYAARFSIRALDVTVDASILWVGAGLAIAAAILLAYVPRLPSSTSAAGLGLAGGSVRMTPGTNRRLRLFATTQIACSFVLLAGAGMLLATFVTQQTSNTGLDTRHVLVLDVPPAAMTVMGARDNHAVVAFYDDVSRRVAMLPGVSGVSVGTMVPWREADGMAGRFAAEGYTPANGEAPPRARYRVVGSGFFGVVGVHMIAGREFTDEDRATSEPVAIVSESVAQRLFPNGDALNRRVSAADSMSAMAGLDKPRLIVGIVPDLDDEQVVPVRAMTIYQPVAQVGYAGRLFVHASGDPHVLIPAVTRAIRQMFANQPVERVATLEDVRAEMLSPDRVKTFVFSGFAGIALLIAVVGIAGVLAFSVSARSHEFGVRLAVGAEPRRLVTGVLAEGVTMAAIGVAAGALGGYALARVAAHLFEDVILPGVVPVIGATVVLVVATAVASLVPAVRAGRVDVLRVLQSE